MRHFKIVDVPLEKELISIFKNISKVLEMEENETYSQISISVFNHWLSEEEAFEQLNQVSANKQLERNAKHFVFSELLIKKFKVFGYIYLKKTEETRFVEFISDRELLKYMKQGSRFYIVIPEIESIYTYGFDDTNHLYYKNKNVLEQIEPLIKHASLYLI